MGVISLDVQEKDNSEDQGNRESGMTGGQNASGAKQQRRNILSQNITGPARQSKKTNRQPVWNKKQFLPGTLLLKIGREGGRKPPAGGYGGQQEREKQQPGDLWRMGVVGFEVVIPVPTPVL